MNKLKIYFFYGMVRGIKWRFFFSFFGGFPIFGAELISLGPERSQVNSHVVPVWWCSFEHTISGCKLWSQANWANSWNLHQIKLSYSQISCGITRNWFEISLCYKLNNKRFIQSNSCTDNIKRLCVLYFYQSNSILTGKQVSYLNLANLTCARKGQDGKAWM